MAHLDTFTQNYSSVDDGEGANDRSCPNRGQPSAGALAACRLANHARRLKFNPLTQSHSVQWTHSNPFPPAASNTVLSKLS
jgi:hypothetical protein